MNEKHNYIAEPFSQVADDHRCVECGEQPDHPSHRAISQPASETPETDAKIILMCHVPGVPIDFARDLERRLHAAEAEHGYWRRIAESHNESLGISETQVISLTAERDTALTRVAKLEGALDKIANPRRGLPEEFWNVEQIGDFARVALQ